MEMKQPTFWPESLTKGRMASLYGNWILKLNSNDTETDLFSTYIKRYGEQVGHLNQLNLFYYDLNNIAAFLKWDTL